ncbi:MAG TPA: ATP-binding protein [Methylomirabilota bacterium]|jgi:signal transduction histidine kinase|nr:ATP-binding protein [Methylomirabilota bacterium]
MRLGIRIKEAVVVTLLTFLIVATTSLIHLSQLSRVVAQEASRQADLVAKQIYAQTSRALSRAPRANPVEVLRRDRELRGLLDASVGYSPHLLFALIADHTGKTILHTEREKEGATPPLGPRLTELINLDPVSRFSTLYRGGRVYETTLPLLLNGEPFGSIRLGVSTTLLKQELTAAVKQSLILVGLALPLAWLAAMGLSQLILRPIRALAGEVDRLRRGEFPASTGLAGGDEFQDLSSQLQRLGQELQADRIATLSERAHLQHVVDQLEDAVIFLSPEREVLFFNKAAEAVVGRPLEQTVGTPLDDLLTTSHPLRPLVTGVLAGDTGFRDTTVALQQDGRSKEFLVSMFPVRDATRVVGTVVLLKDLESVKAVQSLVSYSAKLAALGRLTSGVAHEVKNPLNAMMIHLELLREKLEGSPGEVHQSLEVIVSEIRRLDRVVQGFLRFMRPQELAFKTLDLNALLGSVTALLEAEWQARGVHFAFELDAGLPPMSADEELLRQAFLNILQNACQAMPHGGTVTIRTEREERDAVRISIADEGVGIPHEDLEKIFKLYYTTKTEGTGIGLSLVYRIVQMHDGAIEARSEVGRGTTMIIRLPLR